MCFVQINVVSDKGELLGKSEEARFPLQSAIDAAEPGDTVLLAPGMVRGGGRYERNPRKHRERAKRETKKQGTALLKTS